MATSQLQFLRNACKNGAGKSLHNVQENGFLFHCFSSKSKIIREQITCNQEPCINSWQVLNAYLYRALNPTTAHRVNYNSPFKKCKEHAQKGWVTCSKSHQLETRFVLK